MSDLITAWVDRDEVRRLAETLLSKPGQGPLAGLEIEFSDTFEGYAVSAGDPPPAAPRSSTTESSPATGDEAPAEAESAGTSSTKSPEDSAARTASVYLRKAREQGLSGGILKSGGGENSAPSTASPFRRASSGEPVSTPAFKPTPPSPTVKRPPAPSGDQPILARVKGFGDWLKGPVGVQSYFITNTEGRLLIDEVRNPKLVQVAPNPRRGFSRKPGRGRARSRQHACPDRRVGDLGSGAHPLAVWHSDSRPDR